MVVGEIFTPTQYWLVDASSLFNTEQAAVQVPYAPRPAGAGSYAPRPTAANARPAPQQTAPSHATSRSGSGMLGAHSPATGGYAAPQNGRGDAPRGNGYASANGMDPSAGNSYRGPAPARGAGMASGRGGRGTTGRGPSQNMARCVLYCQLAMHVSPVRRHRLLSLISGECDVGSGLTSTIVPYRPGICGFRQVYQWPR